jgi:hypothetical protein
MKLFIVSYEDAVGDWKELTQFSYLNQRLPALELRPHDRNLLPGIAENDYALTTVHIDF